MTVTLLPDAEQLVVQFLLDQPELAALTPAPDVVTVIPNTKRWPIVRVTRIGGTPVIAAPLHLDAATLQIEAWATTKKAAWRIAETCRALLAARLVGIHDSGVVTGVTFGAFADVNDPAFPDLHRWLFTAIPHIHPATSGGS